MFNFEILITDLMANRWQEPIDIAKKLGIHSLVNLQDGKWIATNKITITQLHLHSKQKDIIKISNEHSEYRWVNYDEAISSFND